MTLRNHMKQVRAALEGSPAWEDAVDNMLLMLAPVMPFVIEELWQRRHPGPSVHDQSWPAYDPALAAADLVTLVVQINGRIRDKLDIPAGTPAAELEGLAMALPKVQEALQGKTIRKVIPVGNKLVNIVVA
jgi:leucyl-tRNA synthetase